MTLFSLAELESAAALVHRAFMRANDETATRLELVGYILPSKISHPGDTKDAQRVAGSLGIRYEVCEIESIVDAFHLTNREAFDNEYDKGNLISRVRANVLSTKAATEKKTIARSSRTPVGPVNPVGILSTYW